MGKVRNNNDNYSKNQKEKHMQVFWDSIKTKLTTKDLNLNKKGSIDY